MRHIIIVILLLTSLIGSVDEYPTMTIVVSKSSVILSDSEGDSANPRYYLSIQQWKLREITETQFEVLR